MISYKFVPCVLSDDGSLYPVLASNDDVCLRRIGYGIYASVYDFGVCCCVSG